MKDYIFEWQKNFKESDAKIDSILDKHTELSNDELDQIAKRETKIAYEKINCLDCANCCKSAPTNLEPHEIKKIASYLGISKKNFESQYLINDFDGQQILNKIPCPFLNDDNTCKIYEVRPQTCSSYPHTDKKGFRKLGNYHKKNLSFCPITYFVVSEMFKNIKSV
ncbi:MAG TPA: YkgJ family cysteine cluster protein [Saprospiraceae bacterium]|nr:YkgJ family cysteine cluster protein [Saprospiraceae bacterium]